MKKIFPRVAGLFLAFGIGLGVSAQNKTFTNPVYNYDSPDPSIQRAQDGTFYCYATNCQTRKSKDLVTWSNLGGVFSTPSWNGGGYAVWATDVNYVDGQYLMYYALALWGNTTETGIGVAKGTSPEKFSDVGKMFRSKEIGVKNSIDACYVEEGDKKYLVWGSFHDIYIAELTEDGLQIKDFNKKTKIAGGAFEGAMIHKRGGYYYLFASVGSCCEGKNSTYRTVVGRSTKLTGPYVNKQGGTMFDNNYTTIIRGNEIWAGPGHNSEIITDDNGDDWIMYHAYKAADPDRGRVLMLDKITWDVNGWPSVNNGYPSSTPMPAPVYYKGSGADVTYRLNNMDLAKSGFKKWNIEEDSCATFVNGIVIGSPHMPIMHAKNGEYKISQTRQNMSNGLYELSLDNFCTNGGAQLVVNNVVTPAHNAANDDKKAPTSRSNIATRFIRTDDYRQRVYGLVTDGKLNIALQGNLAEDESYYAGDLRVVYREKDSAACVSVLESYVRMSQEIIASKDVFYKGYRTRLAELAEEAAATPASYPLLLTTHLTQDSVAQSKQFYASLAEEIARMDEEIATSRSLGLNVEASEVIREEAAQVYAAQDHDDKQVQDLLRRLKKAIHDQAYSYSAGDGTEGNPYRIVRSTQLDHMRNVLKKDTMVYFCLDKDIDMTGFEWQPLNTSDSKYRFRIDFDGQGHLIRNLTMANEGYPSFFGTMCGNCRNVGFVDAKVFSTTSAAAILAGNAGHSSYEDAEGNIIPCKVENCYFTGKIEAKGRVGVVAGMVAQKAHLEIRNVYTNVEIVGNGGSSNYGGGLVGRVQGGLEISQSYAAGPINAPVAGGIVAGGQSTTTPPSTYDNVIAWNPFVDGNTALPFGAIRDMDVVKDVYHLQGMTVNGEEVTDGKTVPELYEIVGNWSDAWHSDPTAGNGYPILAWQFARGDYREECGFEKADGVISPDLSVRPGQREYYNLNGQRVARPTRGIYIIREMGTARKVQIP